MAVEELKESDIGELLTFLARWSPDHPELGQGEIVRWQKCRRWIFRYHGEIIGYIAQIPQLYRYGKPSGQHGTEAIGWGVTLVLDQSPDSERRRSASVHELLSKVEQNPPWQFGAVGVVPEIEEPYRRRGHVVRRDCSMMFARPMKAAPLLRYFGKSTLLAPAVSVAGALIPATRRVSSEKLERIFAFDPVWDDLWDRTMSDQFELYGTRTAEYLNYKLSQPEREYEAWRHVDGGYIIFREARHRVKDLCLLKICDLVASDAAARDLLALAVARAYERRVYGIVALGAQSEKSRYRQVGLYIARPYPVTLPPTISARIRITFFDSDLDNLW
jgi:hypothetical protein